MPVDVGQPVIAAAESIRQTFMIQAQEIEHGGMQIVDLHLVFDRLVSVVVRRTVSHTTPDTPAREPEAEPKGIMIATVASPLGKGSAPKFA